VTRLLHAELLKLATTRLVLWLALLMLGLELLLISLTATQDSVGDLLQESTQRGLVTFAAVSALMSLILGIVSATGEYEHKTVSQTFLVAPVRERVVAAKLIAAALVGATLALVADAVSYGLTALWLSGRSIPSQLASHDTLVVLLGTMLAAALAGALGVGYGSLARRQTAAIVVALIWLLIGEPLLAIVGVQSYAPGHVIAAVVEGGHKSSELLGFWAGVAAALVYIGVAGVLGVVSVKRADVN
jgi:ABC-type transport system involved in multi-copper enzyme maturation permease subunit